MREEIRKFISLWTKISSSVLLVIVLLRLFDITFKIDVYIICFLFGVYICLTALNRLQYKDVQ